MKLDGEALLLTGSPCVEAMVGVFVAVGSVAVLVAVYYDKTWSILY